MSTNLNQDAVENTLVVILMYTVIWSIGLIGISIISFRHLFDKQNNQNDKKKIKHINNLETHFQNDVIISKKKKENNKNNSSSETDNNNNNNWDIESDISTSPAFKMLTNYVDELIPRVFHQQSYLKRIWDEILQHHRYITFFYSRLEGKQADYKRILTITHLLTVQSMLIFMLAVFYDLQVFFFLFY